MGRPVLTPEGLHARVHDRARLHGLDPARVREAQRQGDRPVGRLDRRPRRLGQGHRGDAGPRAQLPDHRRRRLQRLEAVRDAPGRGGGRPEEPHADGQPDRAQRLRHRPGQEDQADPRLPDDHGAQLRRGAARDRLAPADGERTAWRRRSTGSRARTSSSPGSVSNDEAKEIFGEWEEPKPYIRIVPQPQ